METESHLVLERRFAGAAREFPDGKVVQVARSWTGTPYVHQASVKGAGCDCLGLLRGVWREVRGPEPEEPPPYSRDWSEAGGAEETLYKALARHLREIAPAALGPGDVALFRMLRRGPAKHCGIIATGQRHGSVV
jgi:NlpC/P60 family putative phage cell wall peptidase